MLLHCAHAMRRIFLEYTILHYTVYNIHLPTATFALLRFH